MKRLIPYYYCKSIFDIPLSFFKDNNIKYVFSDLDNTLDGHNIYYPTPRVFKLVNDLKKEGISIIVFSNNKELSEALKEELSKVDVVKMSDELGIGGLTLKDIIDELSKPGRDPREDLPKPILRSDVLKFEDLQEGMELTGTVRNVIDFGAFVDIGVHQDGLVHISQICDRYIKHPSEVLSVGMTVKVRVKSIDKARGRIGLTMKNK